MLKMDKMFRPPSLGEFSDLFTFWTGSRCGQVRVRGDFQRGPPMTLLCLTLSDSSSNRKEHSPRQSIRPSSFKPSVPRRRPRCSWVTTTPSNSRPYSSLDPRPTDVQARSMNSALDRKRDAPEESCTQDEHDHSTKWCKTFLLFLQHF